LGLGVSRVPEINEEKLSDMHPLTQKVKALEHELASSNARIEELTKELAEAEQRFLAIQKELSESLERERRENTEASLFLVEKIKQMKSAIQEDQDAIRMYSLRVDELTESLERERNYHQITQGNLRQVAQESERLGNALVAVRAVLNVWQAPKL